MCHEIADTNASLEGDVRPFIRTLAAAPDEPRRTPALTPILDALSDTRATVDLVLLAAESLEPHAARSFGAVLELVRGQLATTLATLQAHATAMKA